MAEASAGRVLDVPSRASRLFCIAHHNRTLFLRRYWTDELKEGDKPTSAQVRLWQDMSRKVAAITGRKVMKTTFVESMIIGEALRFLGNREDALFTTPADAHMTPVLARIEHKVNHIPLFNALVEVYNKNDGVLKFRTGLWWYFRIEGVDGTGRNMVGLRVGRIFADEQAFGAQKAHDARIQVALSPTDTKWWYVGVPNGVRLTPFWRIDQDPEFGAEWSIHRMNSFENPAMGSEQAKADLARAYGGENTNEYLNNVLGLWGEERASTFPSAHLEASQGRNQPFASVEIADTQAIAAGGGKGGQSIPWRALLGKVENALRLCRAQASTVVIGIDHGYSPDPTEVIVAYLDRTSTERSGSEVWRQLCRITLIRIPAREQADFVDSLRAMINDTLDHGHVQAICADMMGYAMAIYHDHLYVDPRFDTIWYRAHTFSANFGGSDVDKDEYGQERTDARGVAVKKGRKQTSTEAIKEMLSANMRDAESSAEFLA